MPRQQLSALLDGKADASAHARSIRVALATLKKLREDGFAGNSKPLTSVRRSGVPPKSMPTSRLREKLKHVYRVRFRASLGGITA